MIRRHLLGAAVAIGVTAWSVTAARAPVHAQPVERVEVDPAVRDAAKLLVALVHTPSEAPRTASELARRAATAARYHLTHRAVGFRDDCSGFVSASYTRAGQPMDGVVASLWDLAVAYDALHWDAPLVGDLVFWENTHDRNHDGRWGDPLTHIGIVVDVEPDGTIVFAHAGTSDGRTLGRMNLTEPHVARTDTGVRLNSFLRRPRLRDPAGATYLASELWVGFATVGEDQDWMVDANALYPPDDFE